jgi:hypothetical protein
VGLFLTPGAVAELRALPRAGGLPVGGFFDPDHTADMARAAADLSATGPYKGVYVTLNPVRPDLLARSPNVVSVIKSGQATTDGDGVRRRWLLIDLDPVRPGQMSATEAEKRAAAERLSAVRAFLDEQGWPAPVEADSGNGYHLLYPIDLPAEDGGLVKRVLVALANRFDDATVKVDRAVFNPARLVRLYGTVAPRAQRPGPTAPPLRRVDRPRNVHPGAHRTSSRGCCDGNRTDRIHDNRHDGVAER